MPIRYPSGDVKWSIASVGLVLRREFRDFDVYLEVVTIVMVFTAMELKHYRLRNKADRIERVSSTKPEGNPLHWSLVKDWEETASEGENSVKDSKEMVSRLESSTSTKNRELLYQNSGHLLLLISYLLSPLNLSIISCNYSDVMAPLAIVRDF